MIEKTKKANIYNYKNAFNVVVNLHLIYIMYKKMGKLKSEIFKQQEFYDDVLGISRQRFSRICKGENFILSKDNGEKLADLFHISKNYFVGGGEWFSLHTVNETDWKCYFNYKYVSKKRFELHLPNKVIQETSDRIDKLIEETITKKLIESTYDVNEPLYRVYHYFKHGVPYTEETQLTKFTRELAKMKITDWKDLLENETELARYGEMLEKHNSYIQAVLTCLRLEK